MGNRRGRINAFIVLVLTIFPLIGTSAVVSADDGGTDIFFPIFFHENDPYYAFGLDGGTVEGLVIDPTDSNILYANSWGAGVYKSTNGGQSWVNMSSGLDSGFVYELAIDPSNHSHILASDYEHGVKQSVNGGQTWSSVSGLPSWCVVYSIEFDPHNPSVVYVGLREPTYYDVDHYVYPGGVYKSTNGGSTWVRKSSGIVNDYIYDLAIDPNNTNIVYAAMHRNGVYKTINGGESWNSKNETMIDGDVRSVQVTPDSSRVYIGFWDGYGLSYSQNGGESWVSVSSTDDADLFVYEAQVDPHHASTVYLTTSTGIYRCESPAASSSCQVIAHQGRFIFDLTLDVHGPVNSNGYTRVMYTGLQNFAVFKSTDAGASFRPSYKNIRANIINAILVDPVNPKIQYVSSEARGLFKTVDGGTIWSPLHDALPIEYINDLALRPSQSNVVYAGTKYNGIVFSANYGESWLSGNSGLSRSEDAGDAFTAEEFTSADIYSWMDPVDLENMLAALPSGGADRSTASNDVTTIGFHLDPAQSQSMFIGTNNAGVKLSTNGGLSWSASGLSSGIVTDNLVNPYGTGGKYFISLEGAGVKMSTDMYTWNNLSSGLPSKVYSIANIPGTSTYFAGTESGIYRLPNTGSSWSLVGMSGLKVTDILPHPGDVTRLWATTNKGLYYSTNSGLTWSYYALPGILNRDMMTIVAVPGTGELLIGTNGGDIYRFTP
ncbi:MAG: hypothetical protein H0S79_03235 [Anaerolineaceae bacterium]|nr:hypothetical protein [Anaerolineaceae bacterium]